jgi:hypothetical protein
MKKIPRITINRIELCKQPKSGAFRTAVLSPFIECPVSLGLIHLQQKLSTDCVQDK